MEFCTNLKALTLSFSISLELRPQMNLFSATRSAASSFSAVRLLYLATPFHTDSIYGDMSQVKSVIGVLLTIMSSCFCNSPVSLSSRSEKFLPKCPERKGSSAGRRQRSPESYIPTGKSHSQSSVALDQKPAKAHTQMTYHLNSSERVNLLKRFLKPWFDWFKNRESRRFQFCIK